MARLILEVTTDASGAIRNIKQFGDATEDAARKTSKLQSLFKGLGIGAGIAGVVGFARSIATASRAMQELADRGGRAASVTAGFRRVVADSNEVLRQARGATSGLITDYELMQKATQASLLGLDTTAKGFAELAHGATVLARAVGKDATEGLERLVLGLGKAEPELLDELGLRIKAEEAYKRYAAQLGVTTTKLTEQQKSTAVLNLALDKVRERVEQLGEVQLTFAERVRQGRTELENFIDQIGIGINQAPGLQAAMGGVVDAMDDAFGVRTQNAAEATGRIVDQVALSFGTLALAGIKAADMIQRAMTRIAQAGLVASGTLTTAAGGLLRGFGPTAEIGKSLLAGGAAQFEGIFGLEQGSDELQRSLAQTEAFVGKLIERLAEGRARGLAMGAGIAEGADQAGRSVDALAQKLVKLPISNLAGPGGKLSQFGQFSPPKARLGVGGTGVDFGDFFSTAFPVGQLQRNRFFDALNPDDLVPKARLEPITKATIDWSNALEDLSRAFVLFGDPGRKLGAFAAGIASIHQSLGLMQQGRQAGGFGGFLGQAAGFLGIAGAGVSMFGGILGGLFGGGEEREVNDLRDEFFGQWEDGFVGLQRQLQGLTNQDLVAQIFDADTVEEFNAAVSKAMGLLDTQTQAQQALEEAVKRYKFSIEELGPAMREQELDKQAGQLLKDFELLVASGIDQETVLRRMADAYNEYIQNALKSGAAVPEAMRGAIEKMIEMGLLLDENGDAFSSIEESGITFTETLSEGLSRLIAKIDELVAALTGIPAVEIPVRFGDPGRLPVNDNFRDPRSGMLPDQAFPSGGLVLPRADGRSLPDGHIPILAKPGEFVLPQGGMRGASIGTVTINVSGAGDPAEVARRVRAELTEVLEQRRDPRLAAAIGRQSAA